MKIKFLLLSFLLLFARGCDFYSTSLWFFQPGGQEGEMNPLTSVLGFGWSGLVISNLFLVGFIIYAFYYYSYRYATPVSTRPEKLTDFISELYFNEKGKFIQVFYKSPKNKGVLLSHVGYLSVRVAIIGSFLATLHNLCQYYAIPFYDTFRNIVGRPLFVIYGLILISFGYFLYRLWTNEFVKEKLNFSPNENP